MTISSFERNASIAEMAVEIDRRGAVIEKLEARLAHIDGIYRGAIDNLNHHQRQLDMDGVEVGVSRQALCEVLIGVEAALSAALPLTASPAGDPTTPEAQAAYWKGAFDRMAARNTALSEALNTASPAGGEVAVKAAFTDLINDVQEWADAVQRGTSWDCWDHHFRALAYGGLDKYREVALASAEPVPAKGGER